MNDLVEWRGISHRYANGAQALKALDLKMHAGETLALLGSNGAGKSTAIKLLLGLLGAQQGTVRIFGMDPSEASARQQLGSVLQVAGLPTHLTVLEQVELHAAYYQRPRAPLAVLEELGLSDLVNRRLNTLSGGQRRRLEMALALVGSPALLVLDEPTVGVDIHERARLLNVLQSLKASGVAILLTTHVIEEAEKLADRVAYLDAGELRFLGSVGELKALGGLQELSFDSGLSAGTLQALDPHAAIESAGRGFVARLTDGNAFLRALLAADPHAQIREYRRASLESALRSLH